MIMRIDYMNETAHSYVLKYSCDTNKNLAYGSVLRHTHVLIPRVMQQFHKLILFTTRK